MRRHRRKNMGEASFQQSAEITGGVVAAEMAGAGSMMRPILIGITTGVSVWLATRILDRIFGIERKS